MKASSVETQPGQALAAARVVVEYLPSSTELTPGTPTRDIAEAAITGRAVVARFSGAAHGEVAVVVGDDLVEALANSPLGALDLTQAVRPAIEAAATTLGPVVIDPGNAQDPAEVLEQIIADGGLVVPLLTEDTPQAAVAICVTAWLTGAHGAAGAATSQRPGLDILHDVELEVTAELGRTRMVVKELLSLLPGAVIELDRAAGGPADLLVNGRMIARGEVVIVDENFGIRITEIVPPSERS